MLSGLGLSSQCFAPLSDSTDATGVPSLVPSQINVPNQFKSEDEPDPIFSNQSKASWSKASRSKASTAKKPGKTKTESSSTKSSRTPKVAAKRLDFEQYRSSGTDIDTETEEESTLPKITMSGKGRVAYVDGTVTGKLLLAARAIAFLLCLEAAHHLLVCRAKEYLPVDPDYPELTPSPFWVFLGLEDDWKGRGRHGSQGVQCRDES